MKKVMFFLLVVLGLLGMKEVFSQIGGSSENQGTTANWEKFRDLFD